MTTTPAIPQQNVNGTHSQKVNAGFRSSKGFIIAVVSIAVFADVFIYGMVIPLIPSILRERLAIPAKDLQKWISILLAIFGGAALLGSPILGFIADKGPSRKTPFVVSLLALAVATALFWAAKSPVELVVARCLQSLSGGAVWIVGNALILDTVGKDQAGTAMGYVSMALTVGSLAGPALGGVLLHWAGYDSVFLVAMSLICIDIILRALMIEPPKNKASQGAVSIPDESEPLLRNGNGQPRYDEPAECPTQSLNQGRERRFTVPPILRLIMSRQLLVVLFASVIDSVLYNMFEAVLPVFVIRTFQWSSFGIGMCFFALGLPSLLSPVFGYVVDSYNPRVVSTFGFTLLTPTLIAMRILDNDPSMRAQIMLFVFLTIAGFAFSAQLVALMVEVSEPVERLERERPGIFGDKGALAQAYALENMAWATGQLIGPILAAELVQLAGWSVMVTVLGAVSAATAVLLAGTSRWASRVVWKRTGETGSEQSVNHGHGEI